MKCPNCGFEIEKPNVKTCPCCGLKITRVEVVPDEGAVPLETPSTAAHQDEMPSNKPSDIHVQPASQQLPEPVMVECPMCRTQVPEDTNFCPNCGNNMHARVEQEHFDSSTISDAPDYATSEALRTNQEPEATEEYDAPSVSTPVVEQEKPTTPSRIDNYRAEDTDQYVENGAYIPDEPEEDANDEPEDTPQKQETSSIPPSIIFIVTAIVSIALGVGLYFLL